MCFPIPPDCTARRFFFFFFLPFPPLRSLVPGYRQAVNECGVSGWFAQISKVKLTENLLP